MAWFVWDGAHGGDCLVGPFESELLAERFISAAHGFSREEIEGKTVEELLEAIDETDSTPCLSLEVVSPSKWFVGWFTPYWPDTDEDRQSIFRLALELGGLCGSDVVPAENAPASDRNRK